jgi:hypothetical protein
MNDAAPGGYIPFRRSDTNTEKPGPEIMASLGSSAMRGFRGTNARFSPSRGVLEWVEGDLTFTLQSETLALDELVIIAESLAAP